MKKVRMKKLRVPATPNIQLSARTVARADCAAVNALVDFYNEWANNEETSPTGRHIAEAIDRVCDVLGVVKPEIIELDE